MSLNHIFIIFILFMLIDSININKYDQSFNIPLERKHKYGEVKTDFKLIAKMFELIPKKLFKNPNIKWCDPCCGSGEFMIFLYHKLDFSLQDHFPNENERRKHITNNMLYMIEINDLHIPTLKHIFGEEANIIHGNYLDINDLNVDIVIGNPPFNINGSIKVPTNKYRVCKKSDGISIWARFIIHSLFTMLKKSRYGYLLFITPSIWMKNDHKMYKVMLKYTIQKIHTMNSSETNKAFHGYAQTPTCYFFMSKKQRHKSPYWRPIKIYDTIVKKYISFRYMKDCNFVSLPLCGISILNKIQKFHYGWSIKAYKTNMRPGYKNLSISDVKDATHTFPNVSTCLLNKTQPILKINYSNIKCHYSGKPKLILAHKMYGFPYYDRDGIYGISNRDNYVICDYTHEELSKLYDFFYTKLGLFLLETTRYRMRYLEKYVFEMIPHSLLKLNYNITDEILFDIFSLDEMERKYINNFHKKDYLKTKLPY
jgi:hypothetical protein